MAAQKLSLSSTVALPVTEFAMPVIGLGVFRNEECKPACLAALEHAYRHIDSARCYWNEGEVGNAVRESGLRREDVFITSKVVDHQEMEDALGAVKDSVRTLGSDLGFFDLYLIHAPTAGKAKRLKAYRGLLEAQKQGLIRTVGVSNYSGRHIDEIKDAGLPLPSVNQVELHPFCQQRPIVDYCRSNGILVQAYTPIVRGKVDHPVIASIAAKHNKTPVQIALRWSLQHGFVPLPKSAQAARIESNADVFDFEILEEDMSRIDALDRGAQGAVTWNPVEAA